MSDGNESSDRFLSRWSRRKHEAARAKTAAPEARPLPPEVPAEPAPAAPVSVPEEPLPPVESLTIESDFTPFLKAKVDEGTRRAALRVLFSDPRFNVMDGLDIYIDDYSKPDPMPEGMLAKIADAYRTISDKLPDAPVEETQAAAPPALAVDAPEAPAPPPDTHEDSP